MRFAVIGTGALSADVIAAGRENGDFELACVCARSEKRAREMLASVGADAPVVRELAAVAADASVDAAYVGAPLPARFDEVMALLAAGKPVLAELPAAPCGDDYRRLAAAAAASGARFAEAARALCTPGFAAVKTACAPLGALRGAHFLFGADDNGRPAAAAPERTAAPLWELACAGARTAIALFGAPDAVEGELRRRADNFETRLCAVLRFGDAQVRIDCSRTEALGRGAQLDFDGGSVLLDDADWPRLVRVRTADGERTVFTEDSPYAGTRQALARFASPDSEDAQQADLSAVADALRRATGDDVPMALPHVGGFVR
ncbi:MAG: Gfo/Idh/MocA family oxidoreductase [Oscillospiraceae bacterium]|nr:Gfo/Idh/MocA family oxidoreductase [Oscillospiraceae bacterium]